MMSKTVETIASNDEHVRCRIYDGDIPADAYWEDKSRLLTGQLAAKHREVMRLQDENAKLRAELYG